jgi:hypothetical protein
MIKAMSNKQEIFQKYVKAVCALRTHFGDQEVALEENESTIEYNLSTQIKDAAWLKIHLPSLAESLLPASFSIKLNIKLYYVEVTLEIYRRDGLLKADVDSTASVGKKKDISIPKEVIRSFDRFTKTFSATAKKLSFGEIGISVDELVAVSAPIALSIEIYLNKIEYVNEALEATVKENQCQKIISFLFLEAFKNVLGSSSLEYFREEFCEAEKRTVILIFGFEGCLRSELLVVCGRGYESELDDFIDKPLSHDVMRKVAETLAFRESHCLWLFPTPLLIPDIFDVNMGRTGHNRMVEEICLQFKSFKALLSVIFLADRVEIENDYLYRVEYKGYGRVIFPVSRALLLSNEPHIESLYKLYKDAYDRFSSDKLEIAQQFLSLMAGNLDELCQRANDVREATKKTYDEALVEKVKGYFDARHKVQERLKTAVAETSNSVISLSRDVSSDLYKISGVIAGAVLGMFLKPDLSFWVTLVASIVIAIYLGLVIFYHLETLRLTYKLRMEQHRAYIKSFKDILIEKEINSFLSDYNFEKIQTMFFDRRSKAIAIYCIFLVLSLLVAAISVINLFF